MVSSVRTFLPVLGAPDALAAVFADDPHVWLPGARRDGADRIVSLHAGSFGRMARMAIGEPWCSGTTQWRSVSWDPISDDGESAPIDRLLPSLDGEVGLHHDGSAGTTLILDGRYRPPGGVLGTAIDAVALRRVARATVGRFLEDVAERLRARGTAYGDGRLQPDATSVSGKGDAPS